MGELLNRRRTVLAQRPVGDGLRPVRFASQMLANVRYKLVGHNIAMEIPVKLSTAWTSIGSVLAAGCDGGPAN